MGLRELARSALLLLLVPLAACASAQGGTAIDVVVSEAEPLSAELTEIELIVEELGGAVARRVRHERVPARYDAGRLLPWSQRVLPATSARAGVLHRFRARGFRADLPVVDVQG
ncbi:MAG: hypothetical protein IT379_13945, partial [Deltaproteobacteria bacterium]|nr:hypothetical protein [Deltaproteobacteria bacterium]